MAKKTLIHWLVFHDATQPDTQLEKILSALRQQSFSISDAQDTLLYHPSKFGHNFMFEGTKFRVSRDRTGEFQIWDDDAKYNGGDTDRFARFLSALTKEVDI